MKNRDPYWQWQGRGCRKKLNAARDLEYQAIKSLPSHNTVAALTSYVVRTSAVVSSVNRTSCILVECFSSFCVMFCSATVSVAPIVVASHAARALRLLALPLGLLPSKSRRGNLGSSMLERWNQSNTRPFSLSPQYVVADLCRCCCAQYGVEALLN